MDLVTNFVVVLAGGLGSRIAPIAKGRPKLLLKLGGSDFLSLKIAEFERNGIGAVLLLTGKGADDIDRQLDAKVFPIPIASLRDGPELRGTGGALRAALPLLPEYFFLTYGDTLLDLPYASLSEVVKRDPLGRSTLAVCRPQDGVDGKCNTRMEGTTVVAHSKVDTSDKDWIDYGISLLKRDDVVLASKELQDNDLSNVYGRLAERGLLSGYVTSDRYLEIGTPASFGFVERIISEKSSQ